MWLLRSVSGIIQAEQMSGEKMVKIESVEKNSIAEKKGIKQGETLLKEGFAVLHFYTMTRTQQVKEIVKGVIGN